MSNVTLVLGSSTAAATLVGSSPALTVTTGQVIVQSGITFSNTTSNPLNTNFAFSNAALGVFSQYTETDKYRVTQNRQWWSEWYLQDGWQASPRLTIDYGARFLWYSPYTRPDKQVANFDPSLCGLAMGRGIQDGGRTA